MQQRKQYLLFACVELYPHEIPRPPKNVPPLKKSISNAATLVSTITVMPVREALEWYESALHQRLKVPCISADVNITVGGLAPEPALGRLVAGAELPFATRWHCGPRIHHLVPLDEPFEVLAWLAPDQLLEARTVAREWLVATTGFDLLAYDEYLFSLVLLAPNPVARSIGQYIRGNLNGGGEKIGISVQPRHGMSLSDVHLLFREERAEGTSVLQECQLDSCGLSEIDLPQPCARASLDVVSLARGVIGTETAARFFRSVHVESRMLAPLGTVNVPGRRKGKASTTYPIAHWEPGIRQLGAGAQSPEMRALQLKMRRTTRTAEAQPEGYARGEDGDERIFFQDREKALFCIRSLVARAQKMVIFVDPFFSHIDVREFAFATQYQNVVVQALTGRGENLFRLVISGDDQIPLGDAFFGDLYALAEELKPTGLRVPDVRLMGDGARVYHDRFLIIDDDVWHIGHSFNQLGQAEVALATRLRHPDQIRTWIIEDVDRATSFLDGWPALKTRRQPARTTCWQRTIRTLKHLKVGLGALVRIAGLRNGSRPEL